MNKDFSNTSDSDGLKIIDNGLEMKSACGEHNRLVFDLSGATSDVRLLTGEESFDIWTTGSDVHVADEDLDVHLVSNIVQEFKSKHRKDISSDAHALCRIRTACQRAKRTLSSSPRASIKIESLFEGIDFYASITRTHCAELQDSLPLASPRTLTPQVFRDSSIDKDNFHGIVHVDRSRIIKLAFSFFEDKKRNESIIPGASAAIQITAGTSALEMRLTRRNSKFIDCYLVNKYHRR